MASRGGQTAAEIVPLSRPDVINAVNAASLRAHAGLSRATKATKARKARKATKATKAAKVVKADADEDSIAFARIAHEGELAALGDSHAEELAALGDSHAEELAALRSGHSDELAALRGSHEDELSSLKAAHSAEASRLSAEAWKARLDLCHFKIGAEARLTRIAIEHGKVVERRDELEGLLSKATRDLALSEETCLSASRTIEKQRDEIAALQSELRDERWARADARAAAEKALEDAR